MKNKLMEEKRLRDVSRDFIAQNCCFRNYYCWSCRYISTGRLFSSSASSQRDHNGGDALGGSL